MREFVRQVMLDEFAQTGVVAASEDRAVFQDAMRRGLQRTDDADGEKIAADDESRLTEMPILAKNDIHEQEQDETDNDRRVESRNRSKAG